MANTKEISWEEATGVTSAEGAVPKFGDAKEISWEDATGNPLPKPSMWERAKTAFGSVQEQTGGAQAQAGLKQVGQEVKALSNMLVGIPGGVAGVAVDIGSRISSIAIGEDPKAAGLRARATAEKTNELWGKVTGALGLSQDASGSKIEELMGKGMEYSDVAGAQAEVATGGIVSKETVQSVRDTLLNALGVKGLAPGKIIAGKGAPAGEALTADAAIKASKARVEALAAEKATAELAKQAEDVAAGTAKAETVNALMKTALENQHPLDKAWSAQKAEAAPGTSPAWDTMVKGLVEPEPVAALEGPGLTPKTRLTEPVVLGKGPDPILIGMDKLRNGLLLTNEEAKAIRRLGQGEPVVTVEGVPTSRATLAERMAAPLPERGAGTFPKTRLAEGISLGEEAPVPTAELHGVVESLLDSGISKLQRGELVSSAEAKAIRALKPLPDQGVIVGPNGKPYFQKGAVDPSLLKVMGLMGLGAVAGTALYNWFQSPSGVSGDNARDVGMGLAGLGAAGIMKSKGGMRYPEVAVKLADHFKAVTGDNIETAGARLASVDIRNSMREAGNPAGAEKTLTREAYKYTPEQIALVDQWEAMQHPSSTHLFHTTSADNLSSIARDGLQPNSSPRFSGVSDGRLSFSANQAVAKYYAKAGDVMLRVRKNYPLENAESDLFSGGEGAYLTDKGIPPEALEIKSGSKWIPLTKAVGKADPAFLAKIAMGTAAGIYAYNNPTDKLAGLAVGLMGATVLHKASSKFTDMPQPDLIAAIKAGGAEAEGAARAIHDATRTNLEKSLYTFKDKLDVEGIVQKTYEKTFQAIASGQFKGESKISTFMHSVAKNEALNELQARKARPQTVSMTEGPEGEVAYPEAAVADTLTPERVAQNTEMAQKMQDSINKLPERQREVFNAAELDGLSYEEIAKTYDMEVGTVRSTLARAREALQKSLKDYKPTQQAGKIENELLIRAGVASGGAILGAAVADDPEKGAIIGGILGLAAASLGTKPVEQALGRGTTRLMEIDPQLRRTVRDMELAASKEVAGASEAIVSFTKPLKKADPVTQVGIVEAYYAADGHAMAEAIKGQPQLVEGYRKVRQFLTKAEESLKTLGRFKEGLPDYLPLVVKDYPGLMASLGQEVRTGLSNMMHKANVEMVKKEGRELTNTERSILTNDFLRNDPATSFQPGFAKARRLKITPETQQFYMPLEEALIHYGHAAMQDVATAKFFGKDLRQSGKEGHQYTNVDNSIGALTDRAMREKRMTPEQAVEVQQILRARFDKGTQAPSGWLQDVRNVTGAALLGQIGSGLIQTSEGLLSTYHHGIKPAAEAVGMLLTRKGIKPSEFGLANHVIEEVIGSRASGKVLSGLLKVNLLATLDQLGMSQNLTASFIKNKQLVNTASGQAKLAEKWGADYGPDMPKLIEELKASTTKSRTPLVDSLLYQELSDVRPTSRSEAPELFNAHPNARLAYHLKQFMITQADVIRRDSWVKIKTGEPKKVAEGLKNLALYAAALSVVTVPSDAIKNWMMGRPLKLDNIDYVENFVRNFGLSRYTMTQVANTEVPGQKMVESAGSMVTPPVASVLKTLGQGMSDPKKLVPFVPMVGRMITNRELGGNERWNKGEDLKLKLEARDARESLYPALRARRLRDAAEKKLAKERKAKTKQRSTQ